MNDFLQKIKAALSRFMQGRHGPDELSMFTIFAGVFLAMLGSITGWSILTFLGFLLYAITLFRMLSRDQVTRLKENRTYLSVTNNIRTQTFQFFRRMKNRKEYKYFRCPKCKILIRRKRGKGKENITCPRCGHQFIH